MFWLFISRFLQFGGLGGVSFDCLVWVDLDLLGWFFWLVFWFGCNVRCVVVLGMGLRFVVSYFVVDFKWFEVCGVGCGLLLCGVCFGFGLL